jgi:protein involved in polysaccharide export with SLBB domain
MGGAKVAIVVALGLVGVMRGPVAWGQTQQPPTQLTGERPDDVMKAAKAPHPPCYPPRVTFTIVSSGNIPEFVASLNSARIDSLTGFLTSKGIDSSQVKVLAGPPAKAESVQVNHDKFTPDNDTDAPKLKVTSIPPKGTKVKPGDKIKFTITASERYEDGHKSWPTGVESIQLVADDGLVDSKDYGRTPPPCESKTFDAIYTVPNTPPAIVHLRAVAEDAVGNRDSDVSAFPTVDWKGTWQLTGQADLVGKPQFDWEYTHIKDTFRAHFALSVDRDGTVNGAADAVVTYALNNYGCFSSSGSAGSKTCIGRCKGAGDMPATTVHLTVTGRLNGQTLHLKLVPATGEHVSLAIAHTCVGEAGTRTYSNTVEWFCSSGHAACATSGHFLEVDLPFVDGSSHKIEGPPGFGTAQGVVQLQRAR